MSLASDSYANTIDSTNRSSSDININTTSIISIITNNDNDSNSNSWCCYNTYGDLPIMNGGSERELGARGVPLRFNDDSLSGHLAIPLKFKTTTTLE